MRGDGVINGICFLVEHVKLQDGYAMPVKDSERQFVEKRRLPEEPKNDNKD